MCQKREVATFADDTSIVKAGNFIDCSMQNELEIRTDWFNYNNMSITHLNVKVCPLVVGIKNS